MALNPIAFTEKVVRSFLRYQLTAYPFADERLHTQMRRLLSLDETRHSPLMKGPYISLSRPFREGAAVDRLIDEGLFHPHMRQRIPAGITHVYLFGNMGAFLVVQAVGTSEGSDLMDAYRGLAQRSPVLALSMLVFLLSLGGIPFVAGFWAKLFIFRAVIDQHMYGLALLGAVLTIVALYYYLVLGSRMYIDAPEKPEPVVLAAPLFAAILVCAVGVVLMGVYPEPWVKAALNATAGLF
jgi:hypothetical protein